MRIVVVHAQDGTVNVAVEDETGAPMESGTGRTTGGDGLEIPRGGILTVGASAHDGGEPDLDSLEQTEPPEGTPVEYALFGVPISEVGAVTLDGLHWLEVMGTIYVDDRGGDPDLEQALTFRVAQAPGGKAGITRFGLEPGATVTTLVSGVVAVTRKAAA